MLLLMILLYSFRNTLNGPSTSRHLEQLSYRPFSGLQLLLSISTDLASVLFVFAIANQFVYCIPLAVTHNFSNCP